ncbi:MAG: alpha-mannosidase, partial [Candidatus Eremiobacteraeota bacterium]|nr:alpha-mannosidase [Candidatus Eremiobacteraeota bacterium]
QNDADYVFTQSQPQLYAWVEEDEPGLFARVRELVRNGRFDPSGAAMWVESDCNIPSGESLVRQLFYGMQYVEREFGTTPSVAWLPDSFGFANTLPTLLAHAGVGAFATTKLRWNDTTEFPHRQFVWTGPDGSSVHAAVIASYEGAAEPQRVALARARAEPLVLGYGDGGGGPTEAIVNDASRVGHWTSLGSWFETWRNDVVHLPAVSDELYLEYHRGVFTTHHDIKSRNAALERSLERAELALAWMTVLRASPFFAEEAHRWLDEAWKLVLRNQFHDVLPGTSIGPVYVDAHADYDHAEALVQRVLEAARASLPRSPTITPSSLVTPRQEGVDFVFENDAVVARVRSDGVVVELRTTNGASVVREANVLCAYVDRPKKWEAWNIDLGYEARPIEIKPLGSEVANDALFVRYRIGASVAAARLSLAREEPFLRVELGVDWQEGRTLLRCENELALRDARSFFGAPHGVVERPAYPRTDAEKAKFEAPGQRYGRVEGMTTTGVGTFALLALDTYGWSVAPAKTDGVRLGHSLLRGTTWPDEDADRGEQRIDYALMPFGPATHGDIEAAWRRFAFPSDGIPALFTPADESMMVVATKRADDGDGIIVRVRECNGSQRDVALHCAARALAVQAVDAREHRVPLEAALQDGTLHAECPAFGLRSFRVRFA